MEKIYHDDSVLIVSEGSLRQAQKEVLKQNVRGVEITTLNRFIQSFDRTNISDWTLRYECYHRFKKISGKLHYFKNSVLSSSFIDECLYFLNLLHFYDIHPDSLPADSKSTTELKIILESIYDFKTAAACQKKILSSIPEDLSFVYIDIQHPTLMEKHLIEILRKHGAKLLHYEECQPVYEYYHANNPRCEIEAIAQKIIKEEMNISDVMVAYCSNTCPSIIVSVFDRYRIPYSLSYFKPSSTAFQAAALLEFALHPGAETFNECLTQNCFGNMNDLIKAQKIYPYAYEKNYPDLKNRHFKGEVFSEYEIQDYIQTIEKADHQKKMIYPYCERLTHFQSVKDLLSCTDEILRHFHTPSLSFNTAMHKIQNLFKESLPYLNEKEDFEILLDEIRQIRIPSSSKRMNSVTIIPYSQINKCLPITFVCSADQSHFAVFKPLSGVFDETYASSIEKFPSLMMRYNHYHKSMTERIQNGQRVIISYPLSNYLGKNFEASLDIERLLKRDSVPYPYDKAAVFQEQILPLSEETADTLYIKKHEIFGSVSSLEKYVGCPYAYFLRYGCHIKEPLETGFNVQKIGTLNHAVLETLMNRYHKDYVKASLDEIIEIIDASIQDMKTVFPHMTFDLIRERLIESMKMNLFLLADMEAASSMTPSYYERKWERILAINEKVNLHLTGYVDRVDTSAGTFRVIDYKSSQKRLEKEKVFSGQQLQLCTYLMQMKDELKLLPLGGFYYSLQNGKLDLPYQKLSRRSKTLEEISEEAIQREMKKTNRLQGWIFNENVELMDDDGSHVSGVKNTKSKGIYAPNVLNIDEIGACIEEMMKQISAQILSGDVRCEPNEAACLFCRYRPICRFNGSFTEKKQLVELPPCMSREDETNE